MPDTTKPSGQEHTYSRSLPDHYLMEEEGQYFFLIYQLLFD